MERKEAIEVIKKNWPDSSFTMLREALETLVPELKESEDERIRKDIIDYLSTADDKNLIPYESWIAYLEKQGENNKWKPSKDEMDALYGLAYITNKMDDKKDEAVTKLYQDLKKEFFSGVSYENMFPLSPVDAPIKLEKQVEKKPADKVEPKFKKGDWVVYDGWTTQIKEVYEDGYSNIHQGFIPKKREEEMRLWTIQDAKDGDVLANWNNTAFIFKAIEDETVKFHIAYNDEKWDEVKTPSTKLSHLGLPEPQFEFHPATKEQRDQLEKAMADAGYTFDFEKKELKEIEQKSSWSKEDEARFKSCIKVLQTSDRYDTINAKWLKSLKNRVQPQQEWSEEDSPYYDDICEMLINLLHSETTNINKDAVQKDLDWLTSLKDKVQPQPTQEWSEEEEKNFKKAIKVLRVNNFLNTADMLQEMKYKLNPRVEINNWKPSDEQMKALEHFVRSICESGCDDNTKLLYSLLSDLKKLK